MKFTKNKNLIEGSYWAVHVLNAHNKNINPNIVYYNPNKNVVTTFFSDVEHDKNDFYYGDKICFDTSIEIENE